MEISERIAEILQALDNGVIEQFEVHIHVGFVLVEFGSANDFNELPPWMKQELVEWAREFEESKTWLLLSNNGERDISAVGLKLLALIKEAEINLT